MNTTISQHHEKKTMYSEFESKFGNEDNAEEAQAVAIERLATRLSKAICEDGVGQDAAGGTVMSLTEAVMGVTAGLVSIANSISDLAEAVQEQRQE